MHSRQPVPKPNPLQLSPQSEEYDSELHVTCFPLELERDKAQPRLPVLHWPHSGEQRLPGPWQSGPAGVRRPTSLVTAVLLVLAVAVVLLAIAGPAEFRESVREFFKSDRHSQMAPSTRFSIGSTEEEVRLVQGAPDVVRGSTWIYGNSRVYFRFGRVIGWNSTQPVPLKVPSPIY